MARVIRIFKSIRTHWKKSTFAAGAIAYGISYGHEKYEINQLMRSYCLEAARYGDVPHPVHAKHKNILVLVNPVADRRSALKNFEEYCAPILHLAGLSIDVVKTDSEGHARRYIEELPAAPDAILVAGGDGTLSEALTGLLRRFPTQICPIGVIPVGRTNTLATQMFGSPEKASNLNDIECIAKAAMSVVQGKIIAKDVMKIEVLPTSTSVGDDHETSPSEEPSAPASESASPPSRPIYAIASLHWGAYRDALSFRDKYWYFGPLRDYATFVFNAFDSDLTWNCRSKLSYTDPCSGCSNCFERRHPQPIEQRRWWSRFIPRFKPKSQSTSEPDLSKNTNENCTKVTEIGVDSTEILVENSFDRQSDDDIPKLSIKFGPAIVTGFDFISNSWARIQTRQNDFESSIGARTVDLIPETINDEPGSSKEVFFSIDNEAFEVKPIRISIIPKAVYVYSL